MAAALPSTSRHWNARMKEFAEAMLFVLEMKADEDPEFARLLALYVEKIPSLKKKGLRHEQVKLCWL